MRADRIDPQLLAAFDGKPENYKLRIIIKMTDVLDPGRVQVLKALGANGALEETVYISTKLTRAAVEALSEEDWVSYIEAPAEPTYHPEPPKWSEY